MDGALRWMVQEHPPWHIAMPEAGAIHPINGGQSLSLERIHDHKQHRLAELLPWNWGPNAAAQSEAA